MNLDHDVFQVRKLSEDQKKKGFHQKLDTLFPKFWWRPKKKGLHQKLDTLFPKFWWRPKKKGLHQKFPRIQVKTCALQSKIIGGDADEDHTQIIGGIYPHRVWHHYFW